MLRADQDLVRWFARTHADARAVERIQTLARRALDWDAAVAIAHRHGVLPLLYLNLQQYCAADVPASVLAALREEFFLNAQRNLMRAQELLRLWEALRAQNIFAVPFKGPLLALSAYGDLSLRQIADLDILIPKGAVPSVQNFLQREGYRLVHEMNLAEEKVFLQSNCALTFERENPHVFLDVHWDLTPKYFYVPLDLDAMLTRLTPVSLAGVSTPTFCAEDLLLILCVHGARHVWGRLDWLVSVAELARANALDWDAVIARAEKSRSERMLCLGLGLAQEWLGADLPEPIQKKIRADDAVAPLAAEISARLWREEEPSPSLFGETFVDELHHRMFKRRRDRVHYYGALFFSPSVGDVAWLRASRFFSFAYFFLRPLRLLIQFGPRWFKDRFQSKARTTN